MDTIVETLRDLDHEGLVALTRMAQLIENKAEPIDLEPVFGKLRSVIDALGEELEGLYKIPVTSIDEARVRQACENDYQMKNTIVSELTYETNNDQIVAWRIAWEAQPFLRTI